MSLTGSKSVYDLSALSILVVDDNDHMLALVRRLLAAMRIENVKLADDAPSAFTAMKAMPPDLIILDWNMIPVNGLDFLAAVRRDANSPNPEVPILMLTAHTELHRILAARDAGVNWVLAKPISFKGLYDALVLIVESDRAFVKSEVYVGPDRRVRRDKPVEIDRRKPGNAGGET
jgi:two-component system chemotaxis response regulator CheY